ncbi:MAG: phenylalanine--tRNA ligase beta subunit-related protein [Chloroflexota bacterium]
MTVFQYHPDILARYPKVVGGVIVAHGIRNGASSADLLAAYTNEQQATIARIGDTPLSQIESLAAWRGVFRSFGVDPTQIRSACEAVLRRLTKQGDIPSINTLVDIGNLVSIRYGLPVAMFDLRSAQGAITVRFADGTESFTNLGQTEIAHPDPGEVIFADENGLVFARRWCWRQSDQSASREDTTDLLVTVEAQHENSRKEVESAVKDLTALLQQFTGSTLSSALLDNQSGGF